MPVTFHSYFGDFVSMSLDHVVNHRNLCRLLLNLVTYLGVEIAFPLKKAKQVLLAFQDQFRIHRTLVENRHQTTQCPGLYERNPREASTHNFDRYWRPQS